MTDLSDILFWRPGQMKQYKCAYCPSEYEMMDVLVQHIQRHCRCCPDKIRFKLKQYHRKQVSTGIRHQYIKCVKMNVTPVECWEDCFTMGTNLVQDWVLECIWNQSSLAAMLFMLRTENYELKDKKWREPEPISPGELEYQNPPEPDLPMVLFCGWKGWYCMYCGFRGGFSRRAIYEHVGRPCTGINLFEFPYPPPRPVKDFLRVQEKTKGFLDLYSEEMEAKMILRRLEQAGFIWPNERLMLKKFLHLTVQEFMVRMWEHRYYE